MSFLLAVMPLAPGAKGVDDCCKGKASAAGCGEKSTRVNYTISATPGIGSATIVGRYEPLSGSVPDPLANTIAFEKSIPLHPTKDVCVRDNFCAKDNRNILLKLSISGEQKGSGFGASFGATWGCSGHKELATKYGLQGGSKIEHGSMKTGGGHQRLPWRLLSHR